jgi:hypothetical protein
MYELKMRVSFRKLIPQLPDTETWISDIYVMKDNNPALTHLWKPIVKVVFDGFI